MSNISEQYRKALLTDETGKLISQKLGGETIEQSGVNTSAEFRKPLMSDETGKEILAKLDDIGGLPDVTEADNGKVLGVIEGLWDIMSVPQFDEIVTISKVGNNYVTDKDWDTIVKPALASNKNVIFQMDVQYVGTMYLRPVVRMKDNQNGIRLIGFFPAASSDRIYSIYTLYCEYNAVMQTLGQYYGYINLTASPED